MRKYMRTISVIVPVYKVEPYINHCVDSILAQTYRDFELILVNDGSPDNCGKICDEYAKQDSRVHVIHQENKGVSAARNAGISLAKGEYIMLVDSDDFITENMLEKMHDCIAESGSDIAICGINTFLDGEETEDKSQMNDMSTKTISGRDACLSIYRMDGRVPIMAWGKLYKSELFTDIRYPVGVIHEDDGTTPKLLYRAKMVSIIDNKMYCYRQRKGSIMDTLAWNMCFDGVKAVDGCIDFFREQKDEELVLLAEKFRKVIQSKIIVKGYSRCSHPAIPKEYRMSLWGALENIRRNSSYDTYMWYLSLVHPKMVKPYSYFNKLKQILNIRGR